MLHCFEQAIVQLDFTSLILSCGVEAMRRSDRECRQLWDFLKRKAISFKKKKKNTKRRVSTKNRTDNKAGTKEAGKTKTGSQARHNYHNKTGNSRMRLTSLLQLAAFRYHLPMLVKVGMNT